jgi:hypothetical protein
MNLVITIVAILMVADAGFTLVNLDRIESFLHSVFPRMNVKKLALVEGLVGVVILMIKLKTGTIT